MTQQKFSTQDEVLSVFQKHGPGAIAWRACASRCDTCGKRRNTYQLCDDFYNNDRLCSECLITQAIAERHPSLLNALAAAALGDKPEGS